MPRKTIRTSDAPSSPYFSQAVKAGSTVYLSGIVGADPKTNRIVGSSIEEQTRQSLENCRSILHAADSDLDDVVEVQVLLARPEDFAGFNAAYTEFFASDAPARSVCKLGVEISGVLVSIRMTAYVGA